MDVLKFPENLGMDENGRRGESNPYGNGFPMTLEVRIYGMMGRDLT